MEENIKRVEKLVHATNSALAQMKFSLMFDDIPDGGSGGGGGRGRGGGGKKSGKGRKVEKLNALESFLDGDDLRQCQSEFQSEASDMLAKMEKMFGANEVNRKNTKALERIKEINKKIFLSRLEQPKPSETEQSRQKLLSLVSEEKFSPGKTSSKGSIISKTGPIVIKEKDTPESPEKLKTKPKLELKNKILETEETIDRGFQTARELAAKVENMTKTEKKNPIGKSESVENVKKVKCRKHSKEKRERKLVPEVLNTRVVDVKRQEEVQPTTKSKLQLQRLPSLNIKGGLTCQMVHNLEIPASEETNPVKPNTRVCLLSHEQVEKEKMNQIVEKLQVEHNCIEETRNYIECFNCGKLIKVRETRPDPRKVDEILRKCDFNVFDPRIDEFVEKQNPIEEFPVEIKSRDVGVMVKTKENPPKPKQFTLREFSDELCRKYKQEAETLENNHLKLDTILQNLFRKVDESREVFQDCHLFRRKPVELTATKPVLVNLIENQLPSRKKLDKKDVKNRNKSRTRQRRVENVRNPEESSSDDQPEPIRHRKTLIMASIVNETPQIENETFTKPETPSSSENEPKETPVNVEIEKPTTPTENNYESDFETEENPESGKKLSTISEEDSELEKKLSEEETTPPKASTPPKTTEPTPKSTPTELVTSLKDILTALQDQFARTESLAEKLTENVKVDKPEGLNRWEMPSAEVLVENLQSARKIPIVAETQPTESELSPDGSEVGGSSLGEIVVSERRRRKKSPGSSISEISFLNLDSGKSFEFD